MTGDTLLETLQADVLAVLLSTPELAGCQIIAEDSGDMEAEIRRKLGPLTEGPQGKNGLVIVVRLPEADAPEANLPGPPLEIGMVIQVIEQSIINRGATGTGIRSSVAAIRTLAALHLRGLGNLLLVAAPKPIQAVAGMPKGYLSHEVSLTTQARGIAPAAKVLNVNAAWQEDDTLLLATMTGGAEIYYTTDGSYPTPTNPEATLYAAPIAGLAVGTVVRAGAYNDTDAPSDLTEVSVVSEVTPGTIPWESIGVPWERL